MKSEIVDAVYSAKNFTTQIQDISVSRNCCELFPESVLHSIICSQILSPWLRDIVDRRLNMELDLLQILFGLHLHSSTHWLRPRKPR